MHPTPDRGWPRRDGRLILCFYTSIDSIAEVQDKEPHRCHAWTSHKARSIS
jgi:hypothetical protein